MAKETKTIGVTSVPSTLSPDVLSTVQNSGDKIRKRGDALDRVPRFRRVRSLGPVAATGLGAAGAYAAITLQTVDTANNFGIPQELTLSGPGYGGIALLTIAGAWGSKYLTRRFYDSRRADNILGQQQELSKAAETTVELFRHKRGKILGRRKKELDLRWYGLPPQDINSTQLRKKLTKVAEVGNAASVQYFVLPQDQVSKYLPKNDAGEVSTQTEWMKRTKRRKLKDTVHGKDKVIVVTPKQFGKIVERIEIIQDNEPLHSIMQVLEKSSPMHPAHEWYKRYADDPKFIRKKLLDIFQASLDLDLDDVGMKFGRNENFNPTKTRVQRFGRSQLPTDDDPIILWRSTTEWLDTFTTQMLTHRNLTMKDIPHILTHSEAYSLARVTEVCEIAAWLDLQGRDIGLGTGEGLTKALQSVQTQPVVPVESLQQRVVARELGTKNEKGKRRKNKKNGIKLRSSSVTKRTVRSAASLILAAGLGVGVGYQSDLAQNAVSNQTNAIELSQALRDGYKSIDSDPHINFDKADAQAKRETPLYQVDNAVFLVPLTGWNFDYSNKAFNWIAQQTGFEFVPSELRNFVSREAQRPDCSLCDAHVGNNENTPNQPIWYIKPFNGMDTSGYWSEKTYNTIDDTVMEWKDQGSYVGDNNYLNAISAAKPIASPNSLNMKKPLVQVQRAIDFGYGTGGGFDAPFFITDSNKIIVPIPVKNGTHVAAAYAPGVGMLRLVNFPDGTHALMLPGSYEGVQNIEYWLASGSATKVRATGQIVPIAFEQTGQVMNAIWEDHIKKRLPTNPIRRMNFEREYIATNFDYSLVPLPNENVIYNHNAYANQILKDKLANCNVANSLLAISNPTELNYVTGFLNSNSKGPQYLSDHEQHAWDVTFGGGIEDATPTTGSPNQPAWARNFFAENFHGKSLQNPEQHRQDNLWKILEGLGLLTAAGAGYWQRKRLLNGLEIVERNIDINVNRLGVLESEVKLKLTPAAHIVNGYDTLTHASYSGGRSSLSEFQSRFPPGVPSLDRESAMRRLAQYARPDEVKGHLADIQVMLSENGESSHTQGLRQARRVIINISQLEARRQRIKENTEEQVA